MINKQLYLVKLFAKTYRGSAATFRTARRKFSQENMLQLFKCSTVFGVSHRFVSMNSVVHQLSRTLSRAGPLVGCSSHAGRRLGSTVASKRHNDRQLAPEEIYAREEKYGAHNYHPLPVALERGQGTAGAPPTRAAQSLCSLKPFKNFPVFHPFRNLPVGCGGQTLL